jgi:hypothetical protein
MPEGQQGSGSGREQPAMALGATAVQVDRERRRSSSGGSCPETLGIEELVHKPYVCE